MRHLPLLFLLVTLATPIFSATTGAIIQVARRLAMAGSEPTPPKEYFVDLGTRDGLREGDLLEVSRMIPVIEAQTAGSFHVLKVVLGRLKVQLAGETSSLCRVDMVRPAAELPPMEFYSFVLGDQVELKSSLPFR